ncbi:MAG TPA: hypothetical protein VLI39_07620 [Sedimentisphaerales bacterium]|nr:hypothetical protein [Sedimentisphaerales bacterium]
MQSYVLEVGDYYIRIVKDGGLVALAANATAWNGATTYAQGDFVSKVSGGVTRNYRALQASSTPGKDPATETAYWSELDALVIHLQTPYQASQVFDLKFCQSADTVYITHPSHPPRKLTRTSHYAWTLDLVAFGASIAAPTSVTRTVGSGTSDYYVITAVSANGEESLQSSSVNMGNTDTCGWTASAGAVYYHVYKLKNGVYGWAARAGTTSFTDSNIIPDMSKCPPNSQTPFSGSGNYPGACIFFEQRLLFARTNNNPQTIWGSRIGNFENFNNSTPLQEDDAYTFTINSNQVNEIRWLASTNELLLGTSGSEWKMTSGSNSDTITPTSVQLRQQSKWGSSNVPPIVVGSTILFCGGPGNTVRDLNYSLELDGYAGNNVTIMVGHLFQDYTIQDWAYQQNPDSIVWVVRDDGALLGLTYAKEHEVWGWHRHDTDGTFESVAAIQNATGQDEVYFVVRRTIDSVPLRYIEQLQPRMPENDIEQAWFLDCALLYDSTPATTITGLDHLEGETVSVFADGSVQPSQVVSSGAITIDHAASKVLVGLPYTTQLETLELDMENQGGTLQDRLRDIKSLTLRLENTRGVWAGPTFARIEELRFREGEDYGDPTELFTGDKEMFLQSGTGSSARICIQNTDPVPLTVLAVIPRVTHGD